MNEPRMTSVEHTEEIHELAAALCKAQASIEHAKRDTENEFFKSRYADLSSVRDACQRPLSENGLSVVQIPEANGPKVSVTTILLHTSGQWMRGTLTLTAMKPDPQAAGSAITYARRYALAAFTGVAPDDDDGNGASQPPSTRPKSQQPPIPAAARHQPANAGPPENANWKTVVQRMLKEIGCSNETDACAVLTWATDAEYTTPEHYKSTQDYAKAVHDHLVSRRDAGTPFDQMLQKARDAAALRAGEAML